MAFVCLAWGRIYLTQMPRTFKTEWVGESNQALAAFWQEGAAKMNAQHLSSLAFTKILY